MTGCQQKTSEDKPYCLEHVFFNRAAAHIQSDIQAMRHEEDLAATPRGWRKIDLNGVRSLDILSVFERKGAVTTTTLLRETDLTPEALEGYLKAFERAGLIVRKDVGSRRGNIRTIVMRANCA